MDKLTKLRQALEKAQLDAIMITSPINRRYVSGFTGTAGIPVVGMKAAYFVTDFRYIEQATEQAKDFTIVQHKQAIIKEVNDQLNQMGVKRVGVEKDHITFAEYEQYVEMIDAEIVPVQGIVEELRLIKTEDELGIMQKAAQIVDDAYEHIQGFIKPGVREIDISNELEFFMRKQGATASSFDTIVASGKRGALPHGVASTKEVQTGELVTLDYGALYQGYCSDTTRTIAVGDISDELKSIYHIVLEAQLKGIEGIKPGVTGKQVDAITRDYITEKGYGEYYGHSAGHGLGMEVHEAPAVSSRSDVTLEAGMVITCEPGIYVPGVGGCRIEDDILVTETGYKLLTHAKKELIQL